MSRLPRSLEKSEYLTPLALCAILPWALCLTCCASSTLGFLGDPEPLLSPAPEGSAEPNLLVDGEKLYLSWLERHDDGPAAFRIAVGQRESSGISWREASTIARSRDLFVNWADFPSLAALDDGTLAAHWLVRNGRQPYAYGVAFATSTDGGLSWTEETSPHRDSSPTEHGFVSLVRENGGLGVLWLDARSTLEARAGTGGTQLMYTHWDGARFGPEILLDPLVCDCCQTSAALAEDGLVAVYRDRSDDEVRDIRVVRLVDGQWSAPRPVHEDGWRIAGCPVNGPSVAARGRHLALAWHTAAEGTPRLLLAFSEDSGATFGAPLRQDEGLPLGRVDLEMLPDGSVVLSWIEQRDEQGEVRVRRVHPNGEASPSLLLGRTSAGRSSGFPRLAASGSEVIVAWTDTGPPLRVRMTRVALAE